MRPAVAILALLTLSSAAFGAEPPSKTAKIEEMFRITKVDQMQTQMLEQIKVGLGNIFDQPGVPAEAKAARKELDDQVFDIIMKRVSWEKMKPEFIKLYSETLSDEEVDSLLAFYKTPGGAALLEKMPVLMKKGMEIGQAQMKDVVPEIQKAVEAFVEKHKGK